MVIPVMVHIPQLHGQPLCDIVASAASNVKFVGNAAAADTQYTGDVAAMMGGNEAGCAASAPSGGSGASDHPVQPAIIVHEDIIETWQHKKTGEKLVMRLARPDDKPLVLDAFSRLSADSVMKRFFGIKAELTEADLRDFTEPAPDDYSIVITVPSTATPQGERIVGIGQFFRLAPKPSEAEVAFLVIDEYQHQGLATRLLKQLLRTGYVRGIDTFTADTLLTNFGMQALVTHHVDGVKAIRDGTEVTLIIPVRNPDERDDDYGKLSPLLTRRNTTKEDPPTFRRSSAGAVPISKLICESHA